MALQQLVDQFHNMTTSYKHGKILSKYCFNGHITVLILQMWGYLYQSFFVPFIASQGNHKVCLLCSEQEIGLQFRESSLVSGILIICDS